MAVKRQSPTQKYLPAWVVQVFGVVLIAATFIAALSGFNGALFVGAGLVLLVGSSTASIYGISVQIREQREENDDNARSDDR